MVAALLLALALTPEERALAWLEREVPAWRRDNGCFSCHNDGDGARALFTAGRGGRVPLTAAWLAEPEQWDRNKGNPAVSDKRLARIQFASALLASRPEAAVLRRAAAAVAAEQSAAGSWDVEDAANLGSPATYGRVLATVMALRVVGAAELAEPAARAARWLSQVRPRSTLDAAALVLAGFAGHAALLRKAQTREGGFGPYAGDPPEVFDTAVAMLALAETDPVAVAKARGWLVRQQAPDGSWPETTRPAGSQSYAQRVSTTAWATLALVSAPERSRTRE